MRRRRSLASGVSFFAFQDIITSVVGIFVLITLIMVLELAQTVAEARSNVSSVISAELLASVEAMNDEVNFLQTEFDKLNSRANLSATTNNFNREAQVEEALAQQRQIESRINRANQITVEAKRSLIEAQQIYEKMIADSIAAESERHELANLQDKRREVERYSAVLEIDKPLIFRDTTQENRSLVLVQLVNNSIQLSDSIGASRHAFSGSNQMAEFEDWLAANDVTMRHFLLIIKPSGVAKFKGAMATLRDAGATYGYDVSPEDANLLLRSEMEIGS